MKSSPRRSLGCRHLFLLCCTHTCRWSIHEFGSMIIFCFKYFFFLRKLWLKQVSNYKMCALTLNETKKLLIQLVFYSSFAAECEHDLKVKLFMNESKQKKNYVLLMKSFNSMTYKKFFNMFMLLIQLLIEMMMMGLGWIVRLSLIIILKC